MKKCIIAAILLLSCPLWAQKIINFENALKIARQNSPDIRQSRLSLERSQELLNAQEAALNSQFSLSVTPYNYTKERIFNQEFSRYSTVEGQSMLGTFSVVQPIVFTDATLSLTNRLRWFDSKSEFFESDFQTGETILNSRKTRSYDNILQLGLDQPLFTYNRTKLALQDVKTDLDYAYLNYVISELQLEQMVAQLFYRAFQNKLALQVAREELNNTQVSYNIIENKVNAGLAAREELFQAELNLITSRSSVQNQNVIMQNSLDDLKQLIGEPIEDSLSVVAIIDQEPVSIQMDRAIQLGLANRMELRQRNLDIRNSKANLTRAEATNEFRGNLRLSYGITGDDKRFENMFDNLDENQQVSVSFEIPIYDWGEQASREKAAQATVRASELNLNDERTAIEINLRKTYRSLKNQAIQIELARQNVKIAQLTYDINLERYENGDLTSMDLNLFQTQLSQNKNGLVDAMINYKLLLLDMKVQTLWDFEKDQAVDTGLNYKSKD